MQHVVGRVRAGMSILPKMHGSPLTAFRGVLKLHACAQAIRPAETLHSGQPSLEQRRLHQLLTLVPQPAGHVGIPGAPPGCAWQGGEVGGWVATG